MLYGLPGLGLGGISLAVHVTARIVAPLVRWLR